MQTRPAGRRRDRRCHLLAGSVFVALAVSGCSSPTSPLTAASTATPFPLTVTGTSFFTAVGQTSQLTAVDSSGVTVTSGVTWTSAVPGVATISTTGLVTATGFGSASILAKTASAQGGVTVFVAQGGGAPKTVTACGGIQAPGSYVLGNDLNLPPGVTGTCFVVSNTAGVQVDCRGHVLPYLVVSGANTVSATNCTVTNQVLLLNATSVSLSSLTVHGGVFVSSSAAVTITNSSIAAQSNGLAAVQLNGDTSVRLQGNTIDGSVASYALYSLNGTGNQVLQNVISGAYNGGTANAGTDDGVLLIGETNDTVQGNTITNFFDAGVEGVNFLANTLVADNTISNVGAAGIGSYWCTDWTNNVIRNNSVTTAPELFYMSYSIGLGQCGAASLAGSFTGNQVIGNRFRSPFPGTLLFVPSPPGGASTAGPFPHMVVSLPRPVTNNLIQGNDFGTNDGPFLSPIAGFTDGGGNLCGPTNPQVSNFPCSGVGSASALIRRR
jgi:hypothetical protein